jgi:hypothetical protein
MSRPWLFALALVLVGGTVRADHCCYTVTWVEKPVTCYKQQWVSRDVPCEVMKPVYREETRVVQKDVLIPVWVEEPREVVTYAYKPRVVMKEVVRCVQVPVTVCDPCTGCCYTACKPQMVCEQVPCTVHDCVPVVNKVMVKVCRHTTEKRNFSYKVVHCDWVKEVVVQKKWECVTVPYQTTVKVPVLVPCCP